MLDTDIIMRAIRKDHMSSIIESAIDAGWKVVDADLKCVFTKDGERVALYFQDANRCIFLR
jgi:hypothetical protein